MEKAIGEWETILKAVCPYCGYRQTIDVERIPNFDKLIGIGVSLDYTHHCPHDDCGQYFMIDKIDEDSI